jgi:hypothetical protein
MNAQNPTGQQPEQMLYTCDHFGTVTNKRVIYECRKGFSGRSRVDIPLKHVTSVSLETSRSWPLFFLLALVGAVCVFAPHVDVNVRSIGVTVLLLDVLVYMGAPTVVVNTAGNDLKRQPGQFWHLREASAFVEAIRAQLVSQ